MIRVSQVECRSERHFQLYNCNSDGTCSKKKKKNVCTQLSVKNNSPYDVERGRRIREEMIQMCLNHKQGKILIKCSYLKSHRYNETIDFSTNSFGLLYYKISIKDYKFKNFVKIQLALLLRSYQNRYRLLLK